MRTGAALQNRLSYVGTAAEEARKNSEEKFVRYAPISSNLAAIQSLRTLRRTRLKEKGEKTKAIEKTLAD